MRPCFKFTAAAANKPAILAIDDEIGFWGVQAKDFRAGLDAVTSKDLKVEINSVGGDVFAGLGIYNMLRNWAKEDGRTVTTSATGLVASIASVIFLAGDKRQMPKNAFGMIHSPMTIAGGTEEDLREAADVLAKIKGSMRAIYTDRMGADEAKVNELLAKDSWLTAEEALEAGFATEITDAVEATARYDVSKLDLPAGASLFKAEHKPEPTPSAKPEPKADDALLAEQIQALAKTAGVEAHVADIALHCTSIADAQARVKAVKEITVLCSLSGMDKRAGAFIKANKSVDEVRAALIKARAEADPEIDSADPTLPKGKQTAVTSHSPTNIWAKHRSQTTKTTKGK